MLTDTADGALQPAVVCAGNGAEREHLADGCVVDIEHGCQLCLTSTYHLLANALLIAEPARLVKDFPLQVARQVLLCHPVVAIGVGIEIAGPVPKTFGIATCILEMRWYLALALLLHHP